MKNKELKAPIDPKVKNDFDIKNIDKDIIKQDLMQTNSIKSYHPMM
jgi:hypothetical protein